MECLVWVNGVETINIPFPTRKLTHRAARLTCPSNVLYFSAEGRVCTSAFPHEPLTHIKNNTGAS